MSQTLDFSFDSPFNHLSYYAPVPFDLNTCRACGVSSGKLLLGLFVFFFADRHDVNLSPLTFEEAVDWLIAMAMSLCQRRPLRVSHLRLA